jgi:hypothetical protein
MDLKDCACARVGGIHMTHDPMVGLVCVIN